MKVVIDGAFTALAGHPRIRRTAIATLIARLHLNIPNGMKDALILETEQEVERKPVAPIAYPQLGAATQAVHTP